MRKIQRLAAVSAMAALTLGLAACGSSEAPSTSGATSAAAAPVTSAPASAAASTDGVTKTTDVFGAACSALPKEGEPGSLTAMGPQPVATAASTNPLLSTLVTAVGKVPGLADTLNNTQNITVYAPYNDAFAAVKKQVGDSAFNALLADPTKLGALLSYHVVAKRYDGAGLIAAGKTTELAGGDVTVTGTGTGADTKITLTDGTGGTANVLCGNIPTSNATVFVIDKVLMPKS